jgi:hypothetical protein
MVPASERLTIALSLRGMCGTSAALSLLPPSAL